MKFTFGIITQVDADSSERSYIHKIFEDIANAPRYDDIEIVIIGGKTNKKWEHYNWIAFDETKKPSWITKKKNIITENAKYDNIVYLHDYVTIDPDWFTGYEKFGENFEICTNPIKNLDGTRFRDWHLWYDDIKHILGVWDSHYLLPYDVTTLSKHMYISGSYWVAKKYMMEKFPLDETRGWGDSEDVVWSQQVRKNHNFSINPFSTTRLLKQKPRIFNDIKPEYLAKLL